MGGFRHLMAWLTGLRGGWPLGEPPSQGGHHVAAGEVFSTGAVAGQVV